LGLPTRWQVKPLTLLIVARQVGFVKPLFWSYMYLACVPRLPRPLV